MVVALTTNHTHFFREPHHFDHFRQHVLPVLKRKQGPIRIWSAGCSSGEEVYTIAMCLLGRTAPPPTWLRHADVRLLATDIAPHVVESVQRGFYADNIASGVPEPYRSTWMRPAPGGLVMADEARQLVTAGAQPVREVAAQGPVRRDLLPQRDDLFRRSREGGAGGALRQPARPGGHLYIGHSERLIGPAAHRMKSCGHTIYAKPETRG
jgi:chemotaxis protein methyltransferase CheR